MRLETQFQPIVPIFLRRFLFALFGVGAIGLGVELVLLEHMEDWIQWVPIVLIGVSIGVGAGVLRADRQWLVRVFQVICTLMAVSAAVGIWYHYRGNVEFELEMYPSRRGWKLFAESMKGATPALAPGAMLQLGLIGLAATFRHPALGSRRTSEA